jgi:hypothetical protein
MEIKGISGIHYSPQLPATVTHVVITVSILKLSEKNEILLQFDRLIDIFRLSERANVEKL